MQPWGLRKSLKLKAAKYCLTTISLLAMYDIEIISQYSSPIEDVVFKYELPYFPPASGDDPILNLSAAELLLDGHSNTRYPTDGLLDFHSLKICSSNAKQMAKYFQLAFNFEEVAYRGLENDSRLIGSHVIRNGGVVLEIVNTLETVEEDIALNVPYFQKDIPTQPTNSAYFKLFNTTIDELINNYVGTRVDKLPSDGFRQRICQKVLASRSFKNSLAQYNRILADTVEKSDTIYNDTMECATIQRFLKLHGEGVLDIAFKVQNAEDSFNKAIDAGAGIIKLPRIILDENGSVRIATIVVPQTDIQHTLIENISYSGDYLPGYTKPDKKLHLFEQHLQSLPQVKLTCIDHCVENYSWNQMMIHATFYAQMFGFHKYWSVDEKEIFTGQTALRSIVMSSSNGKIKMPINEPAKGIKKSQIEEFNDFNGGPGVQHLALKTRDIIATVTSLMQRGIDFNTTSESYYHNLQERLKNDDVLLNEKFEDLKRLNILVDYDPKTRNKKSKICNYILQIFTKPNHDRPTLFIEIIQRHHHDGFGKGTFKGLFESLEEQQRLRGNLTDYTGPDNI